MDKKDTSEKFEDCMKQLTLYRRQKEEQKGFPLKNASYDLDDLKAFYKIVYSKLQEVINDNI